MRQLNESFVEKFKKNKLFELYNKNAELFLGVRDGTINFYYQGASVCKISYSRGLFTCLISPKYLSEKGSSQKKISDEEICKRYKSIVSIINDYSKRNEEKKAQQELIYKNNANDTSNWYCVDMEYVRKGNAKGGRADIIAVSKNKPHRIAIIELKYGSSAYGGSKNGSSILKHVDDFHNIIHEGAFEKYIKKDIVGIVKSMNLLFPNYPIKICNENEIADHPDFYFITLNNNDDGKHSTPKMSMGGYLFNKSNPKNVEYRTKCTSNKTVESKFGDITDPSNAKIYVNFLFSKDIINHIKIKDIIDDISYKE